MAGGLFALPKMYKITQNSLLKKHGIFCLTFSPISAMLNYLDIYPLTLPARYTDRIACYTKVYITSNIPLEEQYRDIQRYQMETWRAFLRRVQNVIEYLRDGSTVQHKKGGFPCDTK